MANVKSIINYKDSLTNQTTDVKEKEKKVTLAQDRVIYRFIEINKIISETQVLSKYLVDSKTDDGYVVTTNELIAIKKIVTGKISVDDLMKQFPEPTKIFSTYLNRVIESVVITPSDELNYTVDKVINTKPFNWKDALATAKTYTRKGVEVGVSGATSIIANTVKTAVELTVVAGKAGYNGVKDGIKKA
jgi:hypothetical protein